MPCISKKKVNRPELLRHCVRLEKVARERSCTLTYPVISSNLDCSVQKLLHGRVDDEVGGSSEPFVIDIVINTHKHLPIMPRDRSTSIHLLYITRIHESFMPQTVSPASPVSHHELLQTPRFLEKIYFQHDHICGFGIFILLYCCTYS